MTAVTGPSGPTGSDDALRFQPLYHGDRLHLVNPVGDVGLITLWTPLRAVHRKLAADLPDALDADLSRIAVIANLYGDGLFAMFCNLLHNPQIQHLVAVGQGLGLGSTAEIAAFLEHGLEDAEMLGRPVKRIRGTDRILPAVAAFDTDLLRERLTFEDLGKLSATGLGDRLAGLLRDLPRPDRVARPPDRVHVAMPNLEIEDAATRPSNVAGHQVIRRRPLDAWEELVVRTARFGRRVELDDGPRIELLNAKAVITDPDDDPTAALAAVGFDIERFRSYQRDILVAALPDDVAYTYGNRLRGYFDQRGTTDALASVVERLRTDRSARGAYVSLWDTAVDLPLPTATEPQAKPCLTTLFFRVADGRLTLTATYRSHNLMTAWLQNVYGLMAIQRHVAEQVDLPCGAITVISHSLTINPTGQRYAVARTLADRWQRDDDVDRDTGKSSLREDPNGYFVVSADVERGVLVADHRFGGVLVKRYEAPRGVTIEQEVSADMAISLVSHAMWLGRELALKERVLHAGGGGA